MFINCICDQMMEVVAVGYPEDLHPPGPARGRQLLTSWAFRPTTEMIPPAPAHPLATGQPS